MNVKLISGCVGSGTNEDLMLPKDAIDPSVTPTIFVKRSLLITAVFFNDESLITLISAWESTRNVVGWLDELH